LTDHIKQGRQVLQGVGTTTLSLDLPSSIGR